MVHEFRKKKIDRKNCGGAAFLAGAGLGGAATNVYMIIFGRVLLGVGVGFANQGRSFRTEHRYYYYKFTVLINVTT